MDMWARLLRPLLLVAVGCSQEAASSCGPETPPLREGSSVEVEVRWSAAGVAPVFVDAGLYGPGEEQATPPPSPAPSQAGTVTKTDGRLVLRLEDGRVMPLTQYFCD